MKNLVIVSCLCLLSACRYEPQSEGSEEFDTNVALDLSLEQAERLSALPLKCLEREYPNKLGQVLADSSELSEPSAIHPAFYGCFDWHSAVHGTWMMSRLMREFPGMDQGLMKSVVSRLITTENILQEIKFFESQYNGNFERTYGWAWLLRLHGEYLQWDDSLGQALAANLEPLADYIVVKYKVFLPKLQYPLRTGEHGNTAFGLSLALDYAKRTQNKALIDLISSKSKQFYIKDKKVNLALEPSGFDFLSPIFEEINLMRKVLPKGEYLQWLKQFLPSLYETDFFLSPVRVSDRSDGKLVHLDGLNLSRAWCLYAISGSDKSLSHLKKIADNHLEAALSTIVDDKYIGEHWLASFALHALLERERVR